MRIAVPVERQAGEARVALTPDSVKKLVTGGVEVAVEAGAGTHAGFVDEEYKAAGASLADRRSREPMSWCVSTVPSRATLAGSRLELSLSDFLNRWMNRQRWNPL